MFFFIQAHIIHQQKPLSGDTSSKILHGNTRNELYLTIPIYKDVVIRKSPDEFIEVLQAIITFLKNWIW